MSTLDTKVANLKMAQELQIAYIGRKDLMIEVRQSSEFTTIHVVKFYEDTGSVSDSITKVVYDRMSIREVVKFIESFV